MKKLLLGTAISLAMAAGASAADLYTKAPPDELSPWYIAARAGLTNLSERDVDYTNPRVFATVGASDDRNFKFVGAAAVGFRLPAMPVRLEVSSMTCNVGTARTYPATAKFSSALHGKSSGGATAKTFMQAQAGGS